MADTEFYHTTEWGIEHITIYNCNFCPFDTFDLLSFDKHVLDDHSFDALGKRLGCRGTQYVPVLEPVKEDKKPVTPVVTTTGDS